MKKLLFVLMSFCLLPTLAQSNDEAYWPHWRGPNENGLVDKGNPPVEWSESNNIKWKVSEEQHSQLQAPRKHFISIFLHFNNML